MGDNLDAETAAADVLTADGKKLDSLFRIFGIKIGYKYNI